MKQPSEEFDPHTHTIISCALEVHNHLGPGFQEVIYQRALFHELKLRNIEFHREGEIDIYYKDKKVGSRRVDFFIEDCLLEIKAKSALEDVDFIQTLSYLRASKKKVGLLINFGREKLEIKRIVN